jgi:hypothetical protein
MNVEFIILTIHHFLFFSKNANFKNYTARKFLIFLIQLIGLTQNVTMPDVIIYIFSFCFSFINKFLIKYEVKITTLIPENLRSINKS